MSISSAWSKTLADSPDIMADFAVDRLHFNPTDACTLVYAPCCLRKTPADTIVDLRGIAGTIVRGGNVREPRDHDWLCDGCLYLLYADAENEWTKSTLLEARGAPIALVHHHRATEHAVIARRKDDNHPKGPQPHEPEVALAAAQSAIARAHIDELLAHVRHVRELDRGAGGDDATA